MGNTLFVINNYLRKYILSIATTGIFALYVFYQKPEPTLLLPEPPIAYTTPAAPQAVDVPTPTNPVPTRAVPPTIATPSPAQELAPSPAPVVPEPPRRMMMGQYRDGQYDGPSTDAYYGRIQVRVVVSGGNIVDVQFLDHPSDRRTSQMINNQAMPYLRSEAIQAQSARVDIVSGATDTSQAFQQSLASALQQAAN